MTAAPRPADSSEQASLRQSEVPDEGTPERAAWDLVVAWVWEDHEYLSPPPLGRVIHDYYPKLIARIAAREVERDEARRALAAAEATTQRYRERDVDLVRFIQGQIASYEHAEYASEVDRITYLGVVHDLTKVVLAALVDAGGAGPGRAG